MSVMSDWQEDKNSPGADEEDRLKEEKEKGVLMQEEDRVKMVQMFNEKGRYLGQHIVKSSPAAVFCPSLHARPHIFL